MPKHDLKPGDRCAAYDADGKHQGLITGVEDGNFIVYVPGDGPYHFHPKQCRRLRKKPKPKPKHEEKGAPHQWWKDRVECWGAVLVGWGLIHKQVFSGPGCAAEHATNVNPLDREVHLMELRHGEKVISRQDLERAWQFGVTRFDPSVNVYFEEFCKALGLGEGEKP